nr:50S ribosomal protein L17 [uncultured Chryseobacterium sp.]
MRHGKKFNHLGRTASHRSALLSNMACSLIEHKRINTTVAKAKALRVYVEPLLTKAKEDTTHNRRIVFSYLQSKEAVTELFRTVAPKIAERNGGYTRIIKTGFRPGDAADTALIELVDFNELYNPNAEEKKTTRRSRRSATATKKEAVVAEALVVEESKASTTEENQKVEEPKAEATDSTEEKAGE